MAIVLKTIVASRYGLFYIYVLFSLKNPKVKLENETVWLSQAQMVELFGCSVVNISLHLKNVFDEAELSDNQAIKEYLIV